MPSYNYRNPAIDSANQGISAVTQALFNAPALRKQAEHIDFQNRLLTAQEATQQALGGKYGAEASAIRNRLAAMQGMPIEIQASENSTAESITKALYQMEQTKGYKAAAKDPSLVANFGRLQAASDGKAIYDMNAHNVTIDKFTGAVGNENNDLNKAAIDYGNDGRVIGNAHAKLYGAQAVTEKSKQTENYAHAEDYKASARNHDASANNQNAQAEYNKNRTNSEKVTESFVGIDKDGNELYAQVPKAAGTQIVKRNTLNDKNANMGVEGQAKELAAIQSIADNVFGVVRKTNGEVSYDDVPVDGESLLAIQNETVRIRRASDNKIPLTDAFTQAVNNLTGGKGVAGLESVMDEGWFGTNIGAEATTRRLPKAQAKPEPKVKPPPKGKPKAAPVQIPAGWSVEEIPDA